MKHNSPIGYGIIGAGIWGELHTRVLTNDPRVNVLGICDINEKRAKEIANKYNIDKYYTDYTAMLADPNIEAISITTPDFAHSEPAINAINSGKHVLIEKPMATTTSECLEIIEAQNKFKKYIMVDFHNRWSPAFYNAYESIYNGEVGKVSYIYFRLSDTTFVPTKYINWASKSSVLWFLGPHAVDTVRWLFNDEVKEVFAVSRKNILPQLGIDTPDFYSTILQFEHGGVAHLEHSWIISPNSPNLFDLKCEIQGSSGTIYIDTSHNSMIQKYTPLTSQGYPYLSHPDTTLMPIVQNHQIGFATESIRHFIESLWADKEPIVNSIDGLRVTEILEAIEKSAKINSLVNVTKNDIKSKPI